LDLRGREPSERRRLTPIIASRSGAITNGLFAPGIPWLRSKAIPMSDQLLPGSLEIHRSEDGETLVLALRGELDLSSAPLLASELSNSASDGFHHILLDLSQLDFLDSRGLGALIQAQREAEANHKVFSLRPGALQVQRLFEVTGLIKHFTFED
jgi:anti-anti-sigma factor